MPKRERKFEKKEVTKEPVTEELKTEDKVEEKPKKKETKKEPKNGKVIIRALNVRTTPEIPEKGNNIIGVATNGMDVVINEDIPAPEGWCNITVELVKGVKATGYVMSKYIGVK